MFGMPPPQPQQEVIDDHTFLAELTPYQRIVLISLMKKQPLTAVNMAVIEALELAERLDLVAVKPMREEWDRMEKWAQAGYRFEDQVFDGFKADKDPKKEGK